jgi:glucose-6-phosphate 1-dehydrogenase
LFGLFRNRFLPQNFGIIGYARSKIELGDFRKRISSKIKLHNEKEKALLDEFLLKCTYESGQYDEGSSYLRLAKSAEALESNFLYSDRVFYMALPPSVFTAVSFGIRQNVYSQTGTNRIIVEKPFGKDSASSKELSIEIAKNWKEEEVRLYVYAHILS